VDRAAIVHHQRPPCTVFLRYAPRFCSAVNVNNTLVHDLDKTTTTTTVWRADKYAPLARTIEANLKALKPKGPPNPQALGYAAVARYFVFAFAFGLVFWYGAVVVTGGPRRAERTGRASFSAASWCWPSTPRTALSTTSTTKPSAPSGPTERFVHQNRQLPSHHHLTSRVTAHRRGIRWDCSNTRPTTRETTRTTSAPMATYSRLRSGSPRCAGAYGLSPMQIPIYHALCVRYRTLVSREWSQQGRCMGSGFPDWRRCGLSRPRPAGTSFCGWAWPTVRRTPRRSER
jgi:hypothetical protein